jgi:putative sterol carrier protein
MSKESILSMFREMASDWPNYVKQLVSYRLEPILGREITCRVDQSEAFTVCFKRDELLVKDGAGERSDADVNMSLADWLSVIKGDVGIMSVIVAGRCGYPKHQRYVLSKMSIILQSLVTIRRSKNAAH